MAKGRGMLPPKGRGIGGSMGGHMETTKGYQKRLRAKRKAEEDRWKSLNGPVVVRSLKDEIQGG